MLEACVLVINYAGNKDTLRTLIARPFQGVSPKLNTFLLYQPIFQVLPASIQGLTRLCLWKTFDHRHVGLLNLNHIARHNPNLKELCLTNIHFELEDAVTLPMHNLTKLVFHGIPFQTACAFFTTASLPALTELHFTPKPRGEFTIPVARSLGEFASLATMFSRIDTVKLLWDAAYDFGQVNAFGPGVRLITTEDSKGTQLHPFSCLLQVFPNALKLVLSYNEQPWAFCEEELILDQPPNAPVRFTNVGHSNQIQTIEICDFFPEDMFLNLIRFHSLPSLRHIIFNDVRRLCDNTLSPAAPDLHAFIDWRLVKALLKKAPRSQLTFIYDGAPHMHFQERQLIPERFLLPKTLANDLLAAGITLQTLPFQPVP
jgi:hypothetical protein